MNDKPLVEPGSGTPETTLPRIPEQVLEQRDDRINIKDVFRGSTSDLVTLSPDPSLNSGVVAVGNGGITVLPPREAAISLVTNGTEGTANTAFLVLSPTPNPEIVISVANGINQTFVDITTAGFAITGNFSVSGVKAFDIEHPYKDNHRLRYIAVESPEVLVMCRGISNTEEEIEYPQHFIDVCEEGSIQCQIGKLRGENKIAWLATGVRKGYADFKPEYKVDE